MESALVKLFQVLCETVSFAACRAYGTADSSFAKHKMLVAANHAFFARHHDSENCERVTQLLKEYSKLLEYRNHIAHGIAVGMDLDDGSHSGYFLCPPSYATKKVRTIDPREVYLLGAAYFLTPIEIKHLRDRFEELIKEAMQAVISILDRHKILELGQLHP